MILYYFHFWDTMYFTVGIFWEELLVFLLTEHYMKSEDPDKWLSPEAVQMGVDCPALKAVEFNSLSL